MADGDFNWISKLAESGKRIRLAPGVIGKSSAVFIGLIVLWIVVFTKLSPTAPWWFNAMLLGGASLVTLLATRETQKNRAFAEANPALALMEGADITEYKKFEAQAKGLLLPDKSPAVEAPFQSKRLRHPDPQAPEQ